LGKTENNIRMQQKTFFQIAGLIFFVAFLLHGFRAFMGWDLLYGPYAIPAWVSWVLVILAGWMAWSAWKMR